MITLTVANTELKTLDREKADKLVSLLGLKDVEYGEFFSEETCDFYNFYFDVLFEQKTPCAVHTDWKWHPEDIFFQLNKSVLGDGLEVTAIKDEPGYRAFEVAYLYGANKGGLKVGLAEPSRLLEDIKKNTTYLAGRAFVEIDFLEDSYSWLIVPDKFDEDIFMQLTGLSRAKSEQEAAPYPHQLDINQTDRQTKKIFFKPVVQVISGNSGRILESDWAGRVVPGQTLREGIAAELKAVYDYSGAFEFSDIHFLDWAKDNKGNDVQRYGIHITLLPEQLPPSR